MSENPEPIRAERIAEGLRLVAAANEHPTDPAYYEPWNAWKFANGWALLVEVAAIRDEVTDDD